MKVMDGSGSSTGFAAMIHLATSPGSTTVVTVLSPPVRSNVGRRSLGKGRAGKMWVLRMS